MIDQATLTPAELAALTVSQWAGLLIEPGDDASAGLDPTVVREGWLLGDRIKPGAVNTSYTEPTAEPSELKPGMVSDGKLKPGLLNGEQLKPGARKMLS